MSEWEDKELGDFIELKRGYDLPAAQRRAGRVPIVSSSGRSGVHDQAKVRGPGVVTGRYGTLGAVYFIEEDFWPLNTALYVCDFKGNDPRFVAALLESLHLGRSDGAAAVPGVNRNHLHRLRIRVPAFRTQCGIASVLKCIDDLIESSRCRAELLEQMANAIYREWFVFFRYPGHEQDERVDSTLDPLRFGWRLEALGDVLKANIGGGWGSAAPDEDHSVEARVIRGTDIPRATRGDLAAIPRRYHGAANAHPRLLEAGDIILEVSGGSKDQPVGRSMLLSATTLERLGPTICASFCKRLVVNPAKVAPELVYLNLRDLYDSGRIEEFQVQSTGIKNLRFSAFLNGHSLLVPPKRIQDRFCEVIGPLLDLAQKLGGSAAYLRTARDILMPRLMAGEISVSELGVARLLEEADR